MSYKWRRLEGYLKQNSQTLPYTMKLTRDLAGVARALSSLDENDKNYANGDKDDGGDAATADNNS